MTVESFADYPVASTATILLPLIFAVPANPDSSKETLK
jgi:hypothetical protein